MYIYFCELLFLHNFIFVTQEDCYERYSCHMDSCAISPLALLLILDRLTILLKITYFKHLNSNSRECSQSEEMDD